MQSTSTKLSQLKLSAVVPTSMPRDTPASPRWHITQKSEFHLATSPRVFKKDFVFGSTHSNVRYVALQEQASADFNLMRYASNEGGGASVDGDDPVVKAGREAYEAQLQELQGTWFREAGIGRASEEFGFLRLRGLLLQPTVPYIDFMRSIVNVAVKQEGEILFTLDRFDFMRYFSDRVAVEQARRNDAQPDYGFPQYVEQCTMGQRSSGKHADHLPHALITCIEFAAFADGPFADVPVTFRDSNGQTLDAERLKSLHATAVQLCSSPENMAHHKATQELLPEARAAVLALQQYVHGTAQMLPNATPWEINEPGRINARLAFGLASEVAPKNE